MSAYQFFARHYDALTQNVDYPRRAGELDAMIRRHLPGGAGALLLDLACGTGSLALELSRLGYEVIGVDASVEMLSVAAEKAVLAPRPPLFLNQRMETLDLYGTVRVTVCTLDSLNHLPDEKALHQAIGRVSLFTEPEGLFLFDLNTAYKHRHILGNNAFAYEPDGLFCCWQNAYQPDDQRVDIGLDFFVPDEAGAYRRYSEQFSEQYFDQSRVLELLSAHRFELLEILDGDTFQPPDSNAQRLLYAARKI